MKIRRAELKDIPKIGDLLLQVCHVHHCGRPDLFMDGRQKYTPDELAEILSDESRPVFVAVDGDDAVLGYAFCAFEKHGGNVSPEFTGLYVDDICVDETMRGRRIGSALYGAVKEFAVQKGCYNITLHVWECNPGARKFYESLGMKTQFTSMEEIL